MATVSKKGIEQIGGVEQIEANILATFKRANKDQVLSGSTWYGDALDYIRTLAAGTSHSVETVAAVMSAVSPRMPWGRNKRIAAELIDRFSRMDTYKGLGLGANMFLAYTYLNGSDPAVTLKNKRFAFWRNLSGDLSYVTVDVHATRLAMNDMSYDGPGDCYNMISDCYIRVADKLNIAPAVLQAITWVVWRDETMSADAVARLDA